MSECEVAPSEVEAVSSGVEAASSGVETVSSGVEAVSIGVDSAPSEAEPTPTDVETSRRGVASPGDVEAARRGAAALSVLSWRRPAELQRLRRHYRRVLLALPAPHAPRLRDYIQGLDRAALHIYTQPRDWVEVEYIFTTEKRSSLQRQRFNSLPLSEVPALLRAELAGQPAQQSHVCTDCDETIPLEDGEPLMEALERHFNLDVHQPKPRRDSCDMAEPRVLPNMSRRLSNMECGETPAQNMEQILQLVKPVEKLDRMFAVKLEAALIRHLPDTSEASIDAAVKFYQGAYDKLCQDVAAVDFSDRTGSVAPIIMSIKDNVNQNFAADANKNFETDDADQAPEKPAKNQVKKYRYYGPIENYIVKLLANHKLLSLVDDRTGKLAFFCAACEYYTLRFRYDSVLGHVLGAAHAHNLAATLQADRHIPFCMDSASLDKIRQMNNRFLHSHGVTEDSGQFSCALCKHSADTVEAVVLHILDETHLARLSDKMYRKMRAANPDGAVPDEWGPKSLDWSKFLASVGKPLNSRDHVVIENFIKPAGKVANVCSCCSLTLKGPRQVLFNHIRQKKHLRHAAPHKLAALHKHHCRPAEYFASFGNYYVCAVCPGNVTFPSFAAVVEHFDSSQHVETIARLVCAALYERAAEPGLLAASRVAGDGARCDLCDVTFQDLNEAITHVLTSLRHQDLVVDDKTQANRGDIISVYMQGNYILHREGARFDCVVCKGSFDSIRSLLCHLVFAEHFSVKPTAENVFRFYLELKHNINMLARNKYHYYAFGSLRCGVCDADVDESENAKRHVVSARHRDNMGASYVHLNEMSAVE